MTTNIQCQVCLRTFKSLSTTHLKTHNMSFDDYKVKYPNASIKSELTKSKMTATLENMIRVHGEIKGPIAFNVYKQKQAYSNSFEYKQQRYGWTKQKYDEYNSSRANTKKNSIKRYGKELGEKKWSEYCNIQRYAGVSYEYFIVKYGNIEGAERYEKMLDKKIHHNFAGHSKVSAELFALIDIDGNGYYAPKTAEYKFKTSAITRRSFFVDYYNPIQRRAIEFYGDYWHSNPAIYTTDFINRSKRTAKEQQEFDANRISSIEKEFNIKILVIWENDFKIKREFTIEQAKAFIYDR